MAKSNGLENGKPRAIELGSPEWAAAEQLVNTYQSGANEIRSGRERVGYKLSDLWNDWYNNLMVICFTLGGALIAVATAIKFKSTPDLILFWAGDCLLLADGLYILLLRKARLEQESTKAITMGYEIEYYSLVAKNRVLDVLKGMPFKQKEFEEAKEKLLSQALAEIDSSYAETSKVEDHMDVMTVLFVSGLGLLGLSTISNSQTLRLASILFLLALLVLIIVFKSGSKRPKEAINIRREWLEKIGQERK